MTKHILIAGLLGGLLGGVVSFTLSRTIKPAKSDAATSTESELEIAGRKVADDYIAKLKAKDIDGFAQSVWTAMQSPTAKFPDFRKEVADVREYFHKEYGPSSGDFEVVLSRPVGQSAYRIVYMEKFERGGLLWGFILYHGKDSWKLDSVSWKQSIGAALASGLLN